MRVCPYCEEEVKETARVCRWCGSDISAADPIEYERLKSSRKRFIIWFWAITILGLIVSALVYLVLAAMLPPINLIQAISLGDTLVGGIVILAHVFIFACVFKFAIEIQVNPLICLILGVLVFGASTISFIVLIIIAGNKINKARGNVEKNHPTNRRTNRNFYPNSYYVWIPLVTLGFVFLAGRTSIKEIQDNKLPVTPTTTPVSEVRVESTKPSRGPTAPAAPTPTACIQSDSLTTAFISGKAKVDVYAGPGVGNNVIDTLAENEYVKTTNRDVTREWSRLEWSKSVDGWVQVKYLAYYRPVFNPSYCDPTTFPAPAPRENMACVIRREGTLVTQDRQINLGYLLPYNRCVDIIGIDESGEWAQSILGWIRVKALEMN